MLCGVTPLLPFGLGMTDAFGWAIALTAGVFFAVGAARSRWSLAPWWRAGLSTLGVGMAAAALAFGVGVLLKALA